VDVGHPAGGELAHLALGRGHVRCTCRDETGGEAEDLVVERDHAEAVLGSEALEDERGCIPCLDHLLPVHGPRAVDHEDEVLGEGSEVTNGGRGDEHEEEPVLVVGLVGEEVQPHSVPGQGVVEDEIAIGKNILLLVQGAAARRRLAAHRHSVSRGVHAPHGPALLHHHLDLHFLKRLGREPLGGQGIPVAEEAALGREELHVFEGDPTRLPRLDREDPGPKRPLADVLEERRVAGLAEVGEVDLPCLIGGENAPHRRFPMDPQGEVLEHRPRRDGKDVGPLDGELAIVAERLVHLGGGHTVLNRHRHVVVDDREPAQGGAGDVRPWDGDDDPIREAGYEWRQNRHQRDNEPQHFPHANHLPARESTRREARRLHRPALSG